MNNLDERNKLNNALKNLAFPRIKDQTKQLNKQ